MEIRTGTARGRWVITSAVLGSGLVMLDGTVVGIALPAIGREFHAGMAALQWVVNGYMLTLAGLLLLGGALGDRYGRRRIFLVGVGWFAVASLLCALARSTWMLTLARALQGIGGALLTPGSLALLQASFAKEDRAKAIGAWSGLGALSAAIGPFAGGYLIQAVSWRLIFFMNLPLTLAVVAITLWQVPESRTPNAGRLDLGGAALAAGGLGALTYGLIEGPVHGWSSRLIVGALSIGGLLLAGFVARERSVAEPMLPPDLFRSKQFTSANAVTFVVYAALGGSMFLLPIALQQVARYTPLQAGMALLPITLLMLTLSARSADLSSRIGPRLQMTAGPIVVAAGMAMFVRVTSAGPTLADYATHVLPAVLVLGLGLVITVAPLTATVLAAAPADHVGVASAVNNAVARAAALIAVAVLPAAASLGGTAYLDPARLGHGFQVAMWIAAAACVVGGGLAALGIRNPRR